MRKEGGKWKRRADEAVLCCVLRAHSNARFQQPSHRPHPPPPPPTPPKGSDFSHLRQQSLKDIGRSYWEDKKRERATRVTEIGGYPVLKENNYSMAQVGG
jgi:hypothetical protein